MVKKLHRDVYFTGEAKLDIALDTADVKNIYTPRTGKLAKK